jgi:hypothetical protein
MPRALDARLRILATIGRGIPVERRFVDAVQLPPSWVIGVTFPDAAVDLRHILD